MRIARRHDLSPRLELLPLLDVVFLLLTFFIYSMVLMVRAEILPVKLTPLGTGQKAADHEIMAVTIDAQGQLFLDRKPIGPEQLQQRLKDLSQLPNKPTLYVAMEAQGATDRGPQLISLIEQIRAAGIEDFAIVGQPRPGSN